MTTKNNNTIKTTLSWGSHGVSAYGVYWEKWRESTSEEMSEADFAKVSEEFTALKELDWAEMRTGDQRPIFSLTRDVLVQD
jgi:hypothetical protein